MIDFGRYEALTFDCYGTLIDWQAGLSAALAPLCRPGGPDAAQLAAFFQGCSGAGRIG